MKTIGKILLAALAYVLGTIASGMIAGALHFPPVGAPPGTTQEGLFRDLLLTSPLLVCGVAVVASGLGGKFLARFSALFALVYIVIGVNTIIEGKIFTNFITSGVSTLFVHYILPSAFVAAVAAVLFNSKKPSPVLPAFSPGQWTWRVLAAWLAFPVVYWTFGMCVAPFVVDYYRAGVAGLVLPGAGTILKTQLLRSPLFLLSTLPAILLWTGSRKRLFISLGIAHALMVGVVGLLQASWFPTVLRVTHSIEITADSFAYAAVLVLLFTQKKSAGEVLRAAAASGR